MQRTATAVPASRSSAARIGRAAIRSAGAILLATSWAVGAALATDATLQAQTPGGAATGTLAGRVVDAVANAPIAGAVATLEGGEAAASSDPSGRFELRGVPAGSHALLVQAPGYQDGRQVVTVVPNRTTTVDVALLPADATPGAPRAHVMFERAGIVPQGLYRSAWAVAPRFNTESYAHVSENDFRLVNAAPRSTFSIDVDRASYANVRRFVRSGDRPPVDAVRIEEMVNYFPYEWGAVAGEHPFSVATEVWEAPWKREHRLVRIGLHAPAIDIESLPASNLVFLLDVSGSMADPAKLPLLKKALALLIAQLRPQDRVAIAVYAGAAGLVLESTPGDRHDEISAALERLSAGGSTAGGAGLELAYKVAGEHYMPDGNNRVILATDGDFNVGPSSDAEMVRLIEGKRDSGVFLTVLGFGAGNLKDSKMEQLADRGNGAYHYVDGLLEARKVLIEEMGGTLLTVARDVKIQVEFNPRKATAYRLIGYENRLLDDEDFNDDAKDAGELGAGHTVTALYEVVPIGTPAPRADPGALRYRRPDPDPADVEADFADELMYVQVRYKDPADGDAAGLRSRLMAHAVEDRPTTPSTDFRFAAAVAGFGMLLRESPHVGEYTLGDAIRLAREGKGSDERGYRGEFIRLAETVRDLGWLKKS